MGASLASHHPYHGLWAAVATMHGKDGAIAPPLGRWFDMTVTTAPGIDTDSLGTFTGEVERQGTLIDAARAKALLAIEKTGASLGIGSEGSFGSHPQIPFLASGLESLVLHHAATGHEVVVVRRTKTNYGHVILGPADDPAPFLKAVGFPAHAVIVRPEDENDNTAIVKAIRTEDALTRAIKDIARRSDTGRVMLQPDMRAHLNPTRMKEIARLARRLAVRLARCCPDCERPGFGITDVERGLPCRACDMPTQLIRAEIHSCRSCGYSMRRFERPLNFSCDERWCPYCNP